MTKRLLSVAVALLMVLALVPVSVFAADRVNAKDASDYHVTYTGEHLTINDPQVGDPFYWIMSAEGWSDVFAAWFLIDYDENYLEPYNSNAFNYTWSAGIRAAIVASQNDGTQSSDMFQMGSTIAYVGQTGDVPVGEAGNVYINCGLYLTSFDYGGLQESGNLFRMRFKWKAVPDHSMNLPMPINVLETTYEYTYWMEGADKPTYDGMPYPAENITVISEGIDVIINGDPITPDPTEAPVETEAPVVTEAPVGAVDVTYTGETVDAGTPVVDATFPWHLDISENSKLFSGRWLVDYDERFLVNAGAKTNWPGGIQYAIEASWDDDEQTSDKPFFAVTPNYEGGTGGAPLGTAGNMYDLVGMYLYSFEYEGVQMGGHMVQLTYKWIAVPTAEDLLTDENGTYLPVPLEIGEHTSVIIGADGKYAAGEQNATLVPGKIYVELPVEPTEAPVTAVDVTYTGETVDAGTPVVGATFPWHLDISENSKLFSGRWLVDYDERFLVNDGAKTNWPGGIQYAIEASWDDDEQTSDKPFFAVTPNYEGGTGGAPLGTAGNMYDLVGMYLYSFEYEGVQMGGHMVQLTYKWIAVPTAEDLETDENGTYLPVPLEIGEHTSVIIGADGKYAAGEQNATLVPGKIYVTLVNEYDLTINYTFADGTEAAPTYTATIAAGESYSVTSPVIEGYTASQTVVSGTMEGDVTVDVIYTPNNYQLRIYYLNAETEMALANAYIATIPYGQTYSVTSPVITGWTCQTPVVEGTMGAGDTEIDVYYVRDVHNVTVHYVDAEGNPMAEDYTGTCGYGLTYSVESPVIPGYTASEEVVAGTMGTEDVEVTVVYTAIPYTVTIHYVDAEGTPVAEDYVNTYVIGDEYSVVSPTIEGYTPDQGTVSGVMGTENVEVTVIYTPVVNGITIHYVYANGTTAADDYTAELAFGQDYSVESPVIPGYTADVAVVEGTMGTEPIVVTVTYTANVHRLTIYYLNAETEMAIANAYFADLAYGTEYSVVSPVIEGYTANILVVEGVMGDEDVTIEVLYTKDFVPTPPTVEGEHAELRERATADGKSDLRFIFKVTFNDSFIVNGGQTYGPTTDYYEITRFYIVLQATGNPMTIEGREIYTMADDSFEFTAVLKGIKADYNSVSITAQPYLEVTMNGETTVVTCDPLVSSVDQAAAYNN